jgi:hypothetical protein
LWLLVVLQELSAAGPSAAAVSSTLAWYVHSQRPLLAAQDMQQLLKANRHAAAAAAPDGGLLYVGQDLYDFGSSSSSDSSEKISVDSLQSTMETDAGTPLLLHTLPGSDSYQDDFSGSSSYDDEASEGFVDASAEEKPAASRRMLLNTAASSSSSASQTAVSSIPGLSGVAGSDDGWSSVSQLASSLRDSLDAQAAADAAAAAAAAAVMPARAGHIPRRQDFRIIGGVQAPRDRCGSYAYSWSVACCCIVLLHVQATCLCVRTQLCLVSYCRNASTTRPE